MVQGKNPGGATTEEVEALIRRGTTAARLGDREEARQAFRQATKLDPTNVEAWLGLSGVVGTLTEKRQCFQRVLELDPANPEAQEGLEAVERRLTSRDSEPISFAPAPEAEVAIAPQPQTAAVCYRHPNIETGLQCMQCGRFICGRCSQLTPVGQICLECRRERRAPNYKVGPVDLVKGFIAAFIAGALGALITRFIPGGFFLIIFIIILGPIIGESVMRIIEYATNKRGPAIQAAVTGGLLGGAGVVSFFIGANWLMLLIFLILAISTAVARLR